ncbi:MAG: 3-phosphoshikimate 1-carboxyvinyltransferase [Prevotellaceae bacterium]|jgi:3-phosphoshikimate 1-carboxyvinyltransferase|nr:3-phosphoshikimate 1-carboxyvinyltransferase [Prevotellaceae bacterium]
MQTTITPGAASGTVFAPASKSLAQRALAAALLCRGETTITGYTESDDAKAALGIIEAAGAYATHDGRGTLTVVGNPPPLARRDELTLNCGESGLSARLFAPLSPLYAREVTLNGRGSLMNRAFGSMMKSPFEQMGIRYSDNGGKLPAKLCGSLSAAEITIDGSGGSQFLSGLLMTLPLLSGNSLVRVENLKSKPYVDLTIDTASKFGAEIENENYNRFFVRGGQVYSGTRFNIEGDWSGASCLLVAGAIAGNVEILNLDPASAQADKAIVEVLRSAGATVRAGMSGGGASSISVSKGELKAFVFDATDSPDLFPALAALAVHCRGVSRIKGVGRLAGKESDRAATLRSEFGKIGATVETDGDYMIVGESRTHGATVDSHNDHRIAMSLAVAALACESAVTVENSECVNKSYPEFWRDLQNLTHR